MARLCVQRDTAIYNDKRELNSVRIDVYFGRFFDPWVGSQWIVSEKDDKKNNINLIEKQNRQWERIFKGFNTEPFIIHDEELLQNTHTDGENICRFVGISTDFIFRLESAPLTKQANAINEWVLASARTRTVRHTNVVLTLSHYYCDIDSSRIRP